MNANSNDPHIEGLSTKPIGNINNPSQLAGDSYYPVKNLRRRH
jgi:hypothetical protein